MRFVFLSAALLSSSMAATLAIKGPLTEVSAYNIHERFVQNSGAKLDQHPYKDYTVELGSISQIDDKDVAYMTDVMNKWVLANGKNLRGVKFDIARCEILGGKKVMLVGDYVYNDIFNLRDSLSEAIESSAPPSGKRYSLRTNCKGNFSPSVYVGDIKGFTPKQVVRRVNRRINHSEIIHDQPYFEVEVDSLRVYH